ALGDAAAVAVQDARADPRSAELAPYLEEHGVGALLDIPLLVPGGILGVVCHEHVGGPRAWHEEEIDFAAQVGALVGVALEAERRVAAERAARGTEARYKHLVESLPVTIYAFDARTGELVYLSPTVEELTGEPADAWPLDRAVARWVAAIDPEFREPVERRLGAGELDGLVEELVYPVDLAIGRRWIRDTVGVVRDAVGRPIAVQGMFCDVTELYRTERARAEAERRYRTLLESVELIAVILDTEGRVEFVNDYFLRLTGFSSEEVVGARWFDLVVPAEERAATRLAFDRAVRGGEVATRTESTLRPRAGRERRIAWTNTVLSGPDGEIVGTSSLGLDITDRLELEAMQMQNQKIESLGRLAVTVAHDFNNLLTVIAAGVEELGDDATPADDRQRARSEIDAAVHQASELTAGLLAYGRRPGSRPARQALDEVAAGALPILERIARDEVRLEVELHADGAGVAVDANHLGQLLVNLVTNAVDATRGHGELVRVTTELVELGQDEARALGLTAGGGYAVLTVADDGAGVAPSARERLFEPFFTTKGPGRGTGLGLAMCESIARRAGGVIAVESAPGHGATFRVYLRLVDE
ncbi:MAG: PAS domain S-box protein, partial [Myxococcales bacterium]|nr:PAS domain S-box protein [Myxococcales bacterium]